MHKRLLIILILLVFSLLFVMGVVAQGAPQQINLALADLNTRLGTAYTLNDFNWSWEQVRFADSSLDCQMEGQTYTAGEIVGYRFIFEVQGDSYDYRVSADESILVLCSVTSLDEVDGEEDTDEIIGDDEEAPYTNPLCPTPPADITYMPTRLTVQIQARVAPGLPNNLRAEPSTTGAVIGEIPGEGIFTVLNGPTCDPEGYLWWQVDFDGLVGFTAEGRNGDYLLEPLRVAPLPTNLSPITAFNMAEVSETSRIQANFGDYLGWSESTEVDNPARLTTVGGLGGAGAWLFNVDALDSEPQFIPSTIRLTDISFGIDPNLALFGSDNGALRFWDVSGGEGLVQRAFLQAHDSPVSAVAFSPNGSMVAGAGGRAFLVEDLPENQYAISLWDVNTVSLRGGLRGHTNTVTGIEFTGNGSQLISAGLDGSAFVWDVQQRISVLALDAGAPITSMTVSPNGRWVALGQQNGSISVWDIVDNQIVATLVNHLDAVNGLSFSPDGGILASGGADGVVLLWNLADTTAAPMILSGHNGAVNDVIFSFDGTLIASLGADNTIRIWTATVNLG